MSGSYYTLDAKYNTLNSELRQVNTELQNTITAKTPKYFSEWRYSTSNTTSTTTTIAWFNGAIGFSDSSPLPANNTTSTFTLGEGVVDGTEYIGQRSSSGIWTATTAGMYNVELVLQPYQSFTMSLYIEYIRDGIWETDSILRSNGAVGIAGSYPYGQVCSYSSIQYLDVGQGMRVRSNAAGSNNFGYIFTHYRSSYWKITRLSGYT